LRHRDSVSCTGFTRAGDLEHLYGGKIYSWTFSAFINPSQISRYNFSISRFLLPPSEITAPITPSSFPFRALSSYTPPAISHEIRPIVFSVKESPRGYQARAVGHAIRCEARSLKELKKMLRSAIAVHFHADAKPSVIRLRCDSYPAPPASDIPITR